MTISKFGNGKAAGKIILIGEHSVVYGKPAIAIPFLNAGIEVSVTATEEPISVGCIYHHGEMKSAPHELDGIKELIRAVLISLNHPLFGLHFDIISSLPTQRGLGSSAAVSVALVRAIYDFFDLELSAAQLNQYSLISERINHGNPSGLDSATITLERAVYFEKGKQESCLQIAVDGILVIADSGRQGNTAEAISEVKQLMERNPVHLEGVMKRLGELTDEVSVLLAHNEVKSLGFRMNEAHSCLVQLGVSDEGIESLIQCAREHGAVGAKLTGSGKGGCIIALCEGVDQALRVSRSLEQAGAIKTWLYDLKEMADHEGDSQSAYQHCTH